MAHLSVDDALAEYCQSKYIESTIKVDPVTVASTAGKVYGIADSLGLLGGDTVERSIRDLGTAINRLFVEIQRLYEYINSIRDELITFVLEVEYRNIAAEVIGLARGVGAMNSAEDRSFLNSAYFDSNPNEIKLLERLEENAEPVNRAGIYMRYLDLFIIHSACRVGILVGAPSLPLPSKVSELLALRMNLEKYCQLARDRLYDIYESEYSIKLCDVDVFYDDNRSEMGTLQSWGYVIGGQSACSIVERVTTFSGQGDGIVRRNRHVVEGARRKVEQEIQRLSTDRAEAGWNKNYRLFTVQGDE